MRRALFQANWWAFLLGANLLSAPISQGETMVEIPEGPFMMEEIEGGSDQTREAVVLNKFSIDRYEVSNREYEEVHSKHSYPEGAGDKPVTMVSWTEAVQHCMARGKRLPKPAEWEKAARGTDGRIYPWGSKKPRRNPQTYYSGVIKKRVGFDKLDVSPYGVRDMAGSVWEWIDDETEGRKVARGGLWNLHLDYEYSKTFDQILLDPGHRFIFLGFRCVQSGP